MTPPQGSETVTTETPAESCPAGPPPQTRLPGTSAASVELFAPGGVLQQWPAPAWLMDRRGRRLVANDAAGGWLESLGDSARDELASRAIEVAASGNPARLSLTIGEGEARRHLAVNLGRLDGGDVLALAHDVSFEGNLRGALVDSRARFKDLVEVSSDFAWECDGAGRFVFVSARGALGWSAADLTDRMARDLICPPPEWAAGDDTLAVIPFETHVPVGECVVWLHTAEGGAACLALSAMPLRDRHGAHSGVRGMGRDITVERRQSHALDEARRREQALGAIVRAMHETVDRGEMLQTAARALTHGLAAAGVALLQPDDTGAMALVAGCGEPPVSDDAWTDIARQARGGLVALEFAECWALAQETVYRGSANGLIVAWFDSGTTTDGHGAFARSLLPDAAHSMALAFEQAAHQERLERLSQVDELTGLANRRAFMNAMVRRIAAAIRSGRPGALVYVDLDNFKSVNDHAGHARGDEALRAVARLLEGRTRSSDIVARVGGDEFALWLDEIDTDAAADLCRDILRGAYELRRFSTAGAPPLGCSIGLASYDPSSGESASALMARADTAMYAAKRAGKGQLRQATDDSVANPGPASAVQP